MSEVGPAIAPAIARVTDRVIERSRESRRRYLDLMDREGERHGKRTFLSCSNLAHGFAAAEGDKAAIQPRRGQSGHRHLVQSFRARQAFQGVSRNFGWPLLLSFRIRHQIGIRRCEFAGCSPCLRLSSNLAPTIKKRGS